MTGLDLDAIEARANAATPGPWEPDGSDLLAGGELIAEGEPHTPHADAEFAAHARTDVPALLAEVRRLRTERDALMPVVEAAKAWRAQFGEFGPLDSADTPSGDLTDAVDALNSGTGGV